MRRLLIPLLLLGSTACTVSAEQFPDAYGTAVCSHAQRCDDLDGSVDECADDFSAVLELFANEDCYDPAEGTACLNATRSLSCEEDTDSLDACNRVYSACR